MRVITLATQKGGSGKSTICRHLAVCGLLDGFTTAIIDADAQGSARDWGDIRKTVPEVLVETSPRQDHVRGAIERMRAKGTDVLFVDTPGSLNGPVALNAAEVSDFVVVPVRPTPDDLNALWPMAKALRDRRVNFAVVLSQCPTNTPRPRLDAEQLLKNAKVSVLPVAIHQKGAIPLSGVEGKTIMELTDLSEAELKSVEEFKALFATLRQILDLAPKKEAA